MTAVERKTVFSEDRRYRYTLWRDWSDDLFRNRTKEGFVMWIGLNPSTADSFQDDPTIRKCIGFTKRWGYQTMCMTNLFAFRATDPRKMLEAVNPVSYADDHANDYHLRFVSNHAAMIVCAWGTKGDYLRRSHQVMTGIIPSGSSCLRKTKDNYPEHPLYVPYEAAPIPFP